MKASSTAIVDLSITVEWESQGIQNRETYFADQVNCWRDLFPGTRLEELMPQDLGLQITKTYAPGELLPDYDKGKIHKVKTSNIETRQLPAVDALHSGRFYPQGILTGIPGIFPNNINPFRCIGIDGETVFADFNHPLAGLPITLSVKMKSIDNRPGERGGSCNDWIALATTGPGMQARYKGIKTDFFSGTPFSRKDPGPDPVFYAKDRFTDHIDAKASEILSKIYGSLLSPGDEVLDLMASWKSHIPSELTLNRVHGLGMNANELKTNPRLTGFTVQDLNTDTLLPFDDHTFDAVICSLSIEYLTHPLDVIKEAARILKRGGKFIVTFSNRWFPTKAIALWENLHDYERMGLVTDYLLESGKFQSIKTRSERGYPRPYDDPYFPRIKLSDPLYCVIGIPS